jgi:hypothetical protein
MKKEIFATALALISVASVNAQVTEVNYSTGGTNVPGYTQFFENFTLTDTDDPLAGPYWGGQDGWAQIGDGNADAVGVYIGFTPSGAGNASGSLGVLFAPEALSSVVTNGFTPTDPSLFVNDLIVRYVAEWSLITRLGDTDAAFKLILSDSSLSDGLVFDLLDDGNVPGGFDYRLQANTANEFALNYNAVYRMQIDIIGTAWSGELFAVNNPGTTREIVSLGGFVGGSLFNGLSSSDLNLLGVGMYVDDLDSDPSLGMVVNEITVTSQPIPESGTWAVGALLVSGLAAGIYRRRKAALAVAKA